MTDTNRDLHGILAEVSELYYKDTLTQSEIAKRKGVARATIVNYLKQARELGIVDISIRGSAYMGSTLSRELCIKYNLADVYIARTKGITKVDDATRKIGRLGAMALTELLGKNEILGVSWGPTTQYAAAEMPYRPAPNLTVCQLIGSMSSNAIEAAESVAIEISKKTNGRCSVLPAPAIVSNSEIADHLRAEPVVHRHFKMFKELTTVFFSAGHTQSNTLVVTSGVATLNDWTISSEANAAAVLNGYFIDIEGDPIKMEYHDRLIGIRPNELRAVPRRILVAGGTHKFEAVKAVLAGGYVTHLVTDDVLAEML